LKTAKSDMNIFDIGWIISRLLDFGLDN